MRAVLEEEDRSETKGEFDLGREWKTEGVMDEQSDESEDEEVMGERIGEGESEMEELVPERGWRRDKGCWFQKHGEAYRKEQLLPAQSDHHYNLRPRPHNLSLSYAMDHRNFITRLAFKDTY